MKLQILARTNMQRVTGDQTFSMPVEPGTYSVKLQKNPSGRNEEEWYIFTKPEEIDPKLKGKTIGAAKIWVMNQTVMSII